MKAIRTTGLFVAVLAFVLSGGCGDSSRDMQDDMPRPQEVVENGAVEKSESRNVTKAGQGSAKPEVEPPPSRDTDRVRHNEVMEFAEAYVSRHPIMLKVYTDGSEALEGATAKLVAITPEQQAIMRGDFVEACLALAPYAVDKKTNLLDDNRGLISCVDKGLRNLSYEIELNDDQAISPDSIGVVSLPLKSNMHFQWPNGLSADGESIKFPQLDPSYGNIFLYDTSTTDSQRFRRKLSELDKEYRAKGLEDHREKGLLDQETRAEVESWIVAELSEFFQAERQILASANQELEQQRALWAEHLDSLYSKVVWVPEIGKSLESRGARIFIAGPQAEELSTALEAEDWLEVINLFSSTRHEHVPEPETQISVLNSIRYPVILESSEELIEIATREADTLFVEQNYRIPLPTISLASGCVEEFLNEGIIRGRQEFRPLRSASNRWAISYYIPNAECKKIAVPVYNIGTAAFDPSRMFGFPMFPTIDGCDQPDIREKLVCASGLSFGKLEQFDSALEEERRLGLDSPESLERRRSEFEAEVISQWEITLQKYESSYLDWVEQLEKFMQENQVRKGP